MSMITIDLIPDPLCYLIQSLPVHEINVKIQTLIFYRKKVKKEKESMYVRYDHKKIIGANNFVYKIITCLWTSKNMQDWRYVLQLYWDENFFFFFEELFCFGESLSALD